jgi:hypothetical protein
VDGSFGCGIIVAAADRALIWPRPTLCLLEEVDAIFTSFFCLLFHVLDNSGHIEFDVGGQHRFCSVDQEERSEADRTIRSGE